ncbi:MAG: transglutaminaseTgpA domain-containing protein [Opitutales bacterium]
MSWSTAGKSAGLTETELHQVKWLMGGMLALIAQWALLSIGFNGSNLMAPLAFLLVVVLLRPGLPGMLPPLFWKALTPALILFILLDFAVNLREGTTIESILRMTALLAFVRALQYRKRREELQLALLCLFALVITGVLTTSLTFALQILLFTPLAMVYLFLVNLLESGKNRVLTREDWRRFEWRGLLRRLGHSLDLRFLSVASLLFLAMAGIGTVIFMAIPRFDFNQGLNFLQMEASGTVGFSDRVGFGEINALSTDNALAMSVEPPSREVVPDRPYWRILVLDRHLGGDFMASSMADTRPYGESGEGNRYASLWRAGPAYAEGSWLVWLEPGVSRYLPLLGPFSELRFSKSVKFTVDEERLMVKQSSPGIDVLAYRVDQMASTAVLPATPREVRVLAGAKAIPAQRGQGRQDTIKYPLTTLEVPDDPEKLAYLREVNREITGGRDLPMQAYAEAASQWLMSNYRYDFEDSATYGESRYPIIDWMQTADRGWCEHFAASLVMLARAYDIPARMIAGFAGADWNDAAGYLLVRQNNAHAWVELFDGENWRRYDPTPVGDASLLGPGSQNAALASTLGTYSGWQAWVDSLRMAWYRRVVNFDQTDQQDLAEDVRSSTEEAMIWWQARRDSSSAGRHEGRTGGWSWRRLLWTALWLCGGAALFLLGRLLWQRLGLLTWGRSPASRRRQIERSRRQASRVLRRFGPASRRWEHEGPSAEIRQQWRQTREALLAIRFGDLSQTEDPEQIFRQARRLLSRPARG